MLGIESLSERLHFSHRANSVMIQSEDATSYKFTCISLSRKEAGALPGLIHQKLVSCAGEVLHVSSGLAVDAVPRRFAHGQEVGPQAADGVLGYVRQGLARSRSEHVAAHGFVDARYILGAQRLVLDARQVNRKALAADDLPTEGEEDTQRVTSPTDIFPARGTRGRR